jgi:hypothetical protein
MAFSSFICEKRFCTPSRFNKDLILVKIKYCGCYFVTLIHPSLTAPLIYETYNIYYVLGDKIQTYAPTILIHNLFVKK